MLRKTLLFISVLLILPFVILLVLSFSITETQKENIEERALEFSLEQYELQKQKIHNSKLVEKGLELLKKNDIDVSSKTQAVDSTIYAVSQNLKSGDSQFLDELRVLSKQERKRLIEFNSLSSLSNVSYIKNFIGIKFITAQEKIPWEFRKFFICNILLLLFIIVMTSLKRIPDRLIVVPILLLLISTLFSIYSYIFNTNWLIRILFGSYKGYAYLGSVLLIFLILIFFYADSSMGLSYPEKKKK